MNAIDVALGPNMARSASRVRGWEVPSDADDFLELWQELARCTASCLARCCCTVWAVTAQKLSAPAAQDGQRPLWLPSDELQQQRSDLLAQALGIDSLEGCCKVATCISAPRLVEVRAGDARAHCGKLCKCKAWEVQPGCPLRPLPTPGT